VATNFGAHTVWPDVYAEPPMYMERPRQPFKTGDSIRMLEDGFSIAKGAVVKAGKVRWVEGHEWCVEVRVKEWHVNPIGFRARRFEKVTESDMKEENLIYAYVEINEQGERIGSPGVFLAANYKDMETFIKQQLTNSPRSTFVYGRMDRKAFVDSPPIKIQNI